jgi:DNA modification methylase
VNVEWVAVEGLTPHPKNSRLHSDEQVRAIAASIQRFGWTVPLLIDAGGGLLAGHGRLRAALLRGDASVPCLRKVGLTDAEKRAYVIADNQIAQGSEWDDQLLRMEIRDLMAQDFDVSVMGFGDDELSALLMAEPEADADAAVGSWTEDDDAPGLPDAPVSRRGDVWVLGRHRVMCGDSCSVDDMRLLAAGERLDLWLTDPPYNVDYQGGTDGKLKIINDSMPDQAFRKFLVDAYGAADAVMKPGAAFYVWHADSEGFNFRGAARDVGWQVRQCLVWRKSQLVKGRQDYHWRHEPCLYGWKSGAAHRWFGGRKQTTVRDLASLGDGPLLPLADGRFQLNVDGRSFVLAADAVAEVLASSVFDEAKPKRNESHPTMKPVSLFEHQVLNSSALGDVVGDSFGGSGTTIVACQKLGRVARLMELDPNYCDVIVKRWQEFVGREAELESTGRSFADTEVERAA